MLHLRARWYAAYLNQFLSPDPIIPDYFNPQSLNQYTYVQNNPVNHIDPSGYCPGCGRMLVDEGIGGGYSVPTPEIISREEWGALTPGFNVVCGPGGACTGTGWAEGMFDPDNPEDTIEGYGNYCDLPDTRDKSLAEVIEQITIHHSGLFPKDDINVIQGEHMFGNGWSDIGYHFVINSSGVIYEGRDIKARGSHVALGNTGKVGVLLIGDFEPGDAYEFRHRTLFTVPEELDFDLSYPTEEQIQSAVQLTRWLDIKYGIDKVDAHRHVDSTECPGERCLFLIPLLNNIAQER